MSEKFALDFDELRYQADRVGDIATDVGSAADAVDTLMLGSEAFGVLCSFLVPPTLTVTAAMASSLRASERLLRRTGTQLRGVAADVASLERSIVDEVRAIEREIGS